MRVQVDDQAGRICIVGKLDARQQLHGGDSKLALGGDLAIAAPSASFSISDYPAEPFDSYKPQLKISLRMLWFGLVWFGLVWFGLVWFGLVWLVLLPGQFR